ncbi:MAG: HAMP domain-containing sensor histidine kinase [Ostreibacterium sp.]
MYNHPHLFKRLIKNNIFRLSVLYSVLFFIASISMLSIVYINMEKNIQTSIERELNTEITRLIGSYQSDQLGIKKEPYAFFIEHNGRKVAGNITEIPTIKKRRQILLQINADKVVTDPAIEQKGEILGKTITLPDRTKLFIGKNSYSATERRKDILDSFSTGLLALLIIGFIGGLFISFRSIRRIDRISKVSKSVIAGNFNLRIPTTHHQDDLEDLAKNINNMLDRINDLMQGMKQVSNNIAHDLRTPLTHLRGNIETISHRATGEIQQEAEQALIETDNLLNTFTSLLRISQVESGANNLQKDNINFSNLVHEVMDFYDLLADEKEQHVTLTIDDNICIYADKTLLSQAVVNLFTNAVKYTPAQSNIRISLTADKNKSFAEFIIHDNGSGVPDEELDKITQR